jgi:hypothetical protein
MLCAPRAQLDDEDDEEEGTLRDGDARTRGRGGSTWNATRVFSEAGVTAEGTKLGYSRPGTRGAATAAGRRGGSHAAGTRQPRSMRRVRA